MCRNLEKSWVIVPDVGGPFPVVRDQVFKWHAGVTELTVFKRHCAVWDGEVSF